MGLDGRFSPAVTTSGALALRAGVTGADFHAQETIVQQILAPGTF
jgi:hypothetical protein